MAAIEFNFYTTDESFDYGDFPGATCHLTSNHGFSIVIDSNDNIDISTLDCYGDYAEMSDIKTLEGLKEYLISHLDEIQELDENSKYTNRECFEELIEIINCNLQAKAA